MSSLSTENPPSKASIVAHSFIGLNCLAFIYGLYGILLFIFQFLRVGSKRFLKRVERPTPPEKATNPIFGVHNMIKLKVYIWFFFLDIEFVCKCFSLRVLHFIMYQKVYQINQ